MKNTRAKLLFSTLRRHVLSGAIAALFFSVNADAQTTLFRFDAKLPNAVTPATDIFQMQFKLFDAASGGAQIGATNLVGAVDVQNRSFTVWLDFGAAAFPGADRYIEINYRRFNHEPFTTLAMRERVLSVPYAIRSLTSGTADNALNLNGVPAADFVQTDDPRLSDDRNPLPGSDHYIQNRSSQQQNSNFNVSGTGTASVINAATQYNLGGQRILDGTSGNLGNLTVGLGAGSLATGLSNTFVGSGAGMNNTGGSQNAFVGNGAGRDLTNGRLNVFVGNAAGLRNTSGLQNAFIGGFAGSSNTIGTDNVALGYFAGASNATGEGNSFLGAGAGDSHSTGDFNTFVGGRAGANTVGGSNNTLLGGNTTIGPNVSNSTGIGANVSVTRSNSIILGTSAQAASISGGIASTFGGGSNPAGLIASNLVFARLGLDFAASSSPLCFRIVSVATQAGESFGGNGLTSCLSSSASMAEKTDVKPFTSGMDVIRHLKPVNFRWKGDGKDDIGLNAEDVAEVVPTMVRRNEKGDANDVKGGGLNALFINAFKEQQTQIEAQEKTIQTQRDQIKDLHRQIEAIRQLICTVNPLVDACK